VLAIFLDIVPPVVLIAGLFILNGRPFLNVLLINVVMPTECLGAGAGDEAARTNATLATALERDVAPEGSIPAIICFGDFPDMFLLQIGIFILCGVLYCQ